MLAVTLCTALETRTRSLIRSCPMSTSHTQFDHLYLIEGENPKTLIPWARMKRLRKLRRKRTAVQSVERGSLSFAQPHSEKPRRLHSPANIVESLPALVYSRVACVSQSVSRDKVGPLFRRLFNNDLQPVDNSGLATLYVSLHHMAQLFGLSQAIASPASTCAILFLVEATRLGSSNVQGLVFRNHRGAWVSLTAHRNFDAAPDKMFGRIVDAR
ncbi:hypothetical protein DE146DRAFT_259004 [Phaeosphaeria sp. MPI-PUGE-AT-0046c]|nr:hypothetical protein DE146DRAFT_259004 [Phaeosphaeria sp. MPI-PUGE-AT-0046c]